MDRNARVVTEDELVTYRHHCGLPACAGRALAIDSDGEVCIPPAADGNPNGRDVANDVDVKWCREVALNLPCECNEAPPQKVARYPPLALLSNAAAWRRR